MKNLLFLLQYLSFYLSWKRRLQEIICRLAPLWRIRGGVCIEIQIGNSSEENEGYKMWNNYTCRIFWQIYRYKNHAVITGEVGCREMHCCIKIALKKIKGEHYICASINNCKVLWRWSLQKNHTRNLWHYKDIYIYIEMLLQGKDLKIKYIFDPNKTKKTVFYFFQLLRWVI